MPVYDTADVARMMGVARITITKYRARFGIGQKFGRDCIFSAADVRNLKAAVAAAPGPGRRPRREESE